MSKIIKYYAFEICMYPLFSGRPGQLVVTAESLGGWPPKVMVAWRPSSDGQQSVTSYKVMAMVATDNWENATWPEPTVVQPDKVRVDLCCC